MFPVGRGLAIVRRRHAGLGAGPSHLRFRSRPYPLRLSEHRTDLRRRAGLRAGAPGSAATMPISPSPSRADSTFRRVIAAATSATSVCRHPTNPRISAHGWRLCLAGRWWAFDPRNNAPRTGRILMAQCRDAADTPLAHFFGQHRIRDFRPGWTSCPIEGVAGGEPVLQIAVRGNPFRCLSHIVANKASMARV